MPLSTAGLAGRVPDCHSPGWVVFSDLEAGTTEARPGHPPPFSTGALYSEGRFTLLLSLNLFNRLPHLIHKKGLIFLASWGISIARVDPEVLSVSCQPTAPIS